MTTPAVRPGQQPSFAPFVSPQAQAYFQNSPEPFGALNKSPIEFAGSKLTLDYKQNNAFGGPENPLLAPRGQLYQNKPTTLMQVLAQGYRQNSERPSHSPLARFIGGAIGGDFNDDTSLASTGGKIVGGLNPVSDIRDIAANGGKIWRGEDGGWSGFGWSLVGSIPVVGDGAKAIFKHGDEVVDGIGNLRHGDEAAESVPLADVLTSAAGRAAQTVGPGRGAVYGTRVHTAFEAEIKGLGNSSLSTEISYLNGFRVNRGTRGSVRLDTVYGDIDAPTTIFDLKTGGATLTPGRIQQIQSHIPGGSNVPVLEIRP